MDNLRIKSEVLNLGKELNMATIAAIATAPSNGGIGIIRMSGKECFDILDKIFKPLNPQKIEEISGYTMKYGHIIDAETEKNIDEVLVSYFKSPKSYTTENMCEINSHGGMIIEQEILKQCLLAGAELAEPGEFTKRAFLNGRIDLSQAEGVIDLINSKTSEEAKASFQQLEGELSKKIQEIRKMQLSIMADIEASIDYPEYDEVGDVTTQRLKNVLTEIREELTKLEESYQNGKILKEGIRTVIVGQPNAGKSSLLNAILGEERAIVSNIEGTTRDTIEEFVTIRGIPLKLIDTAGIRNAKDEVEEIGVQKALRLMQESDLIIDIIDNTKTLESQDKEILTMLTEKVAIILLNKIDEGDFHLENNEEIKKIGKPVIKISAKTKQGIEELYQKIIEMFKVNEIKMGQENIVTNIRHKNQIHKAIESIKQAEEVVEQELPVDLISVPIKQSLEELSAITGENVSEDIIAEIFSKFCLGK